MSSLSFSNIGLSRRDARAAARRAREEGKTPCGCELAGNVSGGCPECGRQRLSTVDKLGEPRCRRRVPSQIPSLFRGRPPNAVKSLVASVMMMSLIGCPGGGEGQGAMRQRSTGRGNEAEPANIVAAIRNQDITWDGATTGLEPRVEGRASRRALDLSGRFPCWSGRCETRRGTCPPT